MAPTPNPKQTDIRNTRPSANMQNAHAIRNSQCTFTSTIPNREISIKHWLLLACHTDLAID